MKLFRNKKIYLDNAGATPLNKSVRRVMHDSERRHFANPSAIFDMGVSVRNKIEESRSQIAKSIGAHSDEIFFTGSGTESVALALLGLIKNYELRIKNEKTKIPHIVTTKIEHPAVLENCRILEERGEAEVTYIEVDENGVIDLKELKESLKDNTILVSVMYANNEIGAIEPIEEIARTIRHFKKTRQEKIYPLFHTDACQAMNYLPTENIEKLGVDMMTFNGSKIYGPKGIGVLYKKRGVEISPIYLGGGQESGLRSGTENVSLIVGISKALFITNEIKEKEIRRLEILQNYFIDQLLLRSGKYGNEIILNGGRKNRLPNNINISVSNISSELLIIELGAFGIYVSEKSACKSEDENKSHVILAIRKEGNRLLDSVRITLGRETKMKDIKYFLKCFDKILAKYEKWTR